MRRWRRILLQIVCAILVLDVWIALHGHKTFERNLAANTVSHVEDLPLRARNQKYYIVAQFWTSSDILHEFWKDALIHLIDTLGHENIYLSFLSSASLDDTNDVIAAWDRDELERLKIPRTVVIDPDSHQDSINRGPLDKNGRHRDGWIPTNDPGVEGEELRRVPYLAKLRNRGLEPLLKMHKEQGIKYDKIIYLNDVKFTTRDILTLLATNDGVYDVACGIDFHLTPKFYDTFALRDSEKLESATAQFPFFRSAASRDALLRGQPVPVTSCWNGVMAADAAPYYDKANGGDLSTTTKSSSLSLSNNKQSQEGLRFRGISDELALMHLEASECCLIHADLIARNQVKKGMFMNPSVRTGYKRDKQKYPTTAYQDVHTGPNGLGWISVNRYVFGVYFNRYRRWTVPHFIVNWRVYRALRKWKDDGVMNGETRDEVGDYCIIDEMHVLISNGWKHVWWKHRSNFFGF